MAVCLIPAYFTSNESVFRFWWYDFSHLIPEQCSSQVITCTISRISYIICGVLCRVKLSDYCSKITKNFKMTMSEPYTKSGDQHTGPCVTTQVTCPGSQPWNTISANWLVTMLCPGNSLYSKYPINSHLGK